MNLENQKLEIVYPCQWSYKIIGQAPQPIREAVARVVGSAEHTLAESNRSRTGKYVSLLLTVTVRDEEHRHSIAVNLRAEPGVIMIL